jgi:hypothetical protein
MSHPYSYGLLLFAFLSVLPVSANAVTPPTCALMQQQVQVARGQGARPISCTRTLAHQQQIKNFYYSRHRYGQVAKVSRNSWHVRGCACDFNRRFHNTEGAWFKGRGHTGNHLSPNGH